MHVIGGDMHVIVGDMAVQPADLAVQLPRDLGVDLSFGPSYDLAWTGCAGTTLANTCVERFFQPFAACFAPGGTCVHHLGGGGFIDAWESGARSDSYFGGGEDWTMSTAFCMTFTSEAGYNQFNSPMIDSSFFCLGVHDSSCYNFDGGTVSATGGLYDETTHIFTCPDGTQVDVGDHFSACPLLHYLIYIDDSALQCRGP